MLSIDTFFDPWLVRAEFKDLEWYLLPSEPIVYAPNEDEIYGPHIIAYSYVVLPQG